MTAMQTEDRANTKLVQTLCKEVTTEQLATLRLLEVYAVARHVVNQRMFVWMCATQDEGMFKQQ